MRFRIRGVEAVKNRNHKLNKKSLKCIKDWETYDNTFIGHAIQKTKCKPYYWEKHAKDVDFCNTLE